MNLSAMSGTPSAATISVDRTVFVALDAGFLHRRHCRQHGRALFSGHGERGEPLALEQWHGVTERGEHHVDLAGQQIRDRRRA